jgi:AcrR family transcriptional regulator
MPAITGGASSVVPAQVVSDRTAASAPLSSEERIGEALLVCMGRWGLAKTTIEDVAREAGLSRATVYRLFPGGKAAILGAAATAEVARLVELLRSELDGLDDRTERLARALSVGARFLQHHEALTFLREHDPVGFEQLVRLDQLDGHLAVAGMLVGPVLRPVFSSDEQSAEAAIWLARLAASHLVNPSPVLDLTDEDDARRLVATFVVPGLDARTVRADPAPT